MRPSWPTPLSLRAPVLAVTVAVVALLALAGDGALYGDSLGPAGSDGATYLEAIRHNARTIVDNLR
jgi:ABC-type Zn uptake system ZnuABC Zn-binding protein ZnuA